MENQTPKISETLSQMPPFHINEHQNLVISAPQLEKILKGVETESIANFLTQNPNCNGINLSDRNLNAENFGQLAQILENLSQIKELVLANNSLGDKGAKIVADLFKANKNITQVNLNNCDITDKGLEYITSCLYISNVKALFIRNNQITDEGIRGLTTNSPLKTLKISGNNLTHGVVDILKQTLPKTKITSISVRNNEITKTMHSELDAICKQNEQKLAKNNLEEKDIAEGFATLSITIINDNPHTHLEHPARIAPSPSPALSTATVIRNATPYPKQDSNKNDNIQSTPTIDSDADDEKDDDIQEISEKSQSNIQPNNNPNQSRVPIAKNAGKETKELPVTIINLLSENNNANKSITTSYNDQRSKSRSPERKEIETDNTVDNQKTTEKKRGWKARFCCGGGTPTS